MTKEQNQEIICILDKSGSMSRLANKTITGLNDFLERQKKTDLFWHFSLIQFNQEITYTVVRQPIAQVEPLGFPDYQPDGFTALLDAIGTALNLFNPKKVGINQVFYPDRVLVFIVTDGLENASKIYSKSQIKELITNLTNKGWEFQFFGANMDSFSEAGGLGIDSGNAMNWSHEEEGVNFWVNAMSEKTKSFRKAKQFFNENNLPNKSHD